MFDFEKIKPVELKKGAHDTAQDGLCFMEMVAWFEGEKHSDKPECACPVLGRYAIGLNDRMPDDVRNKYLLPLVPLMAGTRNKEDEQHRAEFLVMWTVNKILPVVLRVQGFSNHADACEAASSISEARTAAYAAAYAASVSAAAAAAVSAAAAAAAAAASVSAAAAPQIWELAAEGLRQAILIGRHDGFTEIEKFAERADKLLELVS